MLASYIFKKDSLIVLQSFYFFQQLLFFFESIVYTCTIKYILYLKDFVYF